MDVFRRGLSDLGCCSAWGKLIHRLLPWLAAAVAWHPAQNAQNGPFGHKDRGASLLLTFRGVLLHPLCQHPTFHHRPEFTARENFPSKNMHQGCAFNRGFFLVIIILQLNLRSHKSKDMNGHDPTYFCMASSLTQPGYSRPSICVQIAFLDLQRYYQTIQTIQTIQTMNPMNNCQVLKSHNPRNPRNLRKLSHSVWPSTPFSSGCVAMAGKEAKRCDDRGPVFSRFKFDASSCLSTSTNPLYACIPYGFHNAFHMRSIWIPYAFHMQDIYSGFNITVQSWQCDDTPSSSLSIYLWLCP